MLKSSGRLLTLLLVAALFVMAQAPVTAQDGFKDAKKDFESAKKDGSATKMGRAVDLIAASLTPEARDYLLSVLSDDQKDRKNRKPGLPGEVRKKVIMGLSVFTDDESVGKIGEAVLKIDSLKDPVAALDQFDFFLALVRMNKNEAATKVIIEALAESKVPNPYIKCAALEAVRQGGDSRFVDAVVAITRESNKEWWTKWKVVPINVFACLEVIAQTDDNEACVKAVEATADLAKVWEDDKIVPDDRVRYFAGKMLKAITGEIADVGSWQFWKWWALQKKAVGKAPKVDKAPKREITKARAPVFNVAPVGKRFVFSLDMSLSMNLPLKIDLPEIEKRPPEPPKSGNRKQDADPEEQKRQEEEAKRIAAEEKKRGIDALKELPWKTISTKLELAREELARAISKLEDGTMFAIILWSTDVECITNGWVKADAASKAKWSKSAREIEAVALTNMHGGLMGAMRVTDKGFKVGVPAEPSVDPDCIISGADCIVFLTDGWGSWSDDSTAQTKDDPRGGTGKIGDGTHILGPEIWPDIARQNLFRKVIIHCVGIGNHDKECLRHLAKDSGGTYIDWYFPE
jgi:hypothetical protein